MIDCKYVLMLIICCVMGLLVSPVYAEVITSNVDDKEIVNTYGISYTIHTVDFGDICVSSMDYQKIMINDNITFDTKCGFMLWDILKINGVDV